MEKRESGSDKLSHTAAGDTGNSGHDTGTLPLSVILSTYNRSTLLQMALASLVDQTLDKENFEVVVIDDGSSDTTREVANSFAGRLQLRYFYQKNAGLAAGKNHGIYAAKGRILFFFDDDDIATPWLLEEHLRSHQQYADESYAVLGYTTWSPRLKVTPLMKFITEVGCLLFNYPSIQHGSVLDYTYFWGGRSSCKRSFLIEHGVFNPIFRFGCEDIELGYRLSHQGLKVVYNATAVTYMVREVKLEDFYGRLLRQGRSQYHFSTMHADPQVTDWCEVTGAEEKWRVMAPVYDAMVKSTQNLERIVHEKLLHGLEFDSLTEKLLYQAYWWTFRATKIKGIMEAQQEDREPEPRLEANCAVRGEGVDRGNAFDLLLTQKPDFHDSPDGGLVSWGVSEEVLRFIYATVGPGMMTLETGAGWTTVAFATAGANHICITPSDGEVDRILQYCSDNGVSTDRLVFLKGSSDKVLACSDAIPGELDFVFIDGAHRFPFPCIDWHHTEGRLKVGGILGVDDIAMPSVRVLCDFLSNEDEWREFKSFGNTLFYKKVSPTQSISDWQGQKMNRQSNWNRQMLTLNP